MTIQKVGRRKPKNYDVDYCKADVLHGCLEIAKWMSLTTSILFLRRRWRNSAHNPWTSNLKQPGVLSKGGNVQKCILSCFFFFLLQLNIWGSKLIEKHIAFINYTYVCFLFCLCASTHNKNVSLIQSYILCLYFI